MSSKLRQYSCVTCCTRIKTSERRPLSGNKALRKFLSKRFVTDLHESDVVCNKCRQLFYYSLRHESQAQDSILMLTKKMLPHRKYVRHFLFRLLVIDMMLAQFVRRNHANLLSFLNSHDLRCLYNLVCS